MNIWPTPIFIDFALSDTKQHVCGESSRWNLDYSDHLDFLVKMQVKRCANRIHANGK